VIDLIDQALAGETPSMRFLQPEDFLLIEEFGHGKAD